MTAIPQGWVPLSQERDPRERARRELTVQAHLREHRVVKAGGTPCPRCGGGMPSDPVEPDDICQCGGRQARAWSQEVVAAHHRVAMSWDTPTVEQEAS